MAPNYTAEEKRWLKRHWRSEFYFLRAHGLSTYKSEDRAERKTTVQTMIKAHESQISSSTTNQADVV